MVQGGPKTAFYTETLDFSPLPPHLNPFFLLQEMIRGTPPSAQPALTSGPLHIPKRRAVDNLGASHSSGEGKGVETAVLRCRL